MVDMPYNQMKPNLIYLIYMYKEDLSLKNLQGLIYHKTKPNQTKPNLTYLLYCIKRIWH